MEKKIVNLFKRRLSKLKKVPNILTFIRLCLVPVFIVVFLLESDQKTLSGAIFILASATDVLDGYLARKFNATSKVGQLLDPLADKLMQIAAIVMMLIAKILPLWFVIFLATKEILMICAGFFLYSKKTFVKSNIFGKLNTIAVFAAITVLMFFFDVSKTVQTIMLSIVVCTSFAAMISYLYSYFLHHKKFKEYINEPKTEDI